MKIEEGIEAEMRRNLSLIACLNDQLQIAVTFWLELVCYNNIKKKFNAETVD